MRSLLNPKSYEYGHTASSLLPGWHDSRSLSKDTACCWYPGAVLSVGAELYVF